MQNLEKHFTKWCVWRLGAVRAGSKPAKVPCNPNTGGEARANDPGTFGTYDEAQAALERGEWAGVGVLMASGADTVCVDVDECLDAEGKPNAIAEWALDRFAGYCEVSQSGKGLHFFMRAGKPEGCKTKTTAGGCSLEIYGPTDTRFLAVTGKQYGSGSGSGRSPEILPEQPALERFVDHFGFIRADTAEALPRPDTDEEAHSDAEIIGLLKQNNKRGKITRLLRGDLTDYKGDASAADLGLCSEIAFYTCDPVQLRSIFETSELAKRDKWRERADYRDSTITKALGSCVNYYWDKDSAGGAGATLAAGYAARLTGGAEGLRLTRGGKLQGTIENATQVLLRDHRTQGAMGFNDFSGAAEVLRPLREVFGVPASEGVGEFRAADITAVRAWLGREYEINLTKNDTDDVVQHWARYCRFNPVTDGLNRHAAAWDGVPRLRAWLRVYLGVDPDTFSEYTSEIGMRWMIGAVARAFAPGCKVDAVLVLEGAQGAGKSRAIRALAEAVYPAGFAENIPVVGGGKEAALALRGCFIAELAELSAVRRGETEGVKAFLTAQEDRIREPYGRRFEQWKRTVSFCGTTNETEHIQDPTGGRRFWSVTVGSIDTDALRRDAAHLWGEAVHAYRGGETWHLTDANVLRQATEQQQARQVSDTWDDAVLAFADKIATTSAAEVERWSLQEIFALTFPGTPGLDERQQAEQRRFGGVLRRAGFAPKKVRGRNRWHLEPQRIEEAKQRALEQHP